MWMRLLWVLGVGTAMLGGMDSAAEPLEIKTKVNQGDRAPDFKLRDLESNIFQLSDFAYKGKEFTWKKKKKVLLDFFRTDCEPCLKELPQVIDYHKKYHNDVQVLMIALLERENGKEKLDEFVKAQKIPFPVLVDAYENVAKDYIAHGDQLTLPSIFLIDRNGTVKVRIVGLEEELETILQKSSKKTRRSKAKP